MPENLRKTNVKIFQDTEAYNLAKAVKSQNVSTIKRICTENPELMYVQDPHFFYTVLHWAVGMEKYSSVKTLLEMGMNPNVTSTGWNITPLFIAASYSFVDNDLDTNPKYVEILLEYGADPNIAITEVLLPDIVQPNGNIIGQSGPYADGETPLMRTATPFSTGRLIEKARLLVEMGNANVNQTTTTGRTAAGYALSARDISLAYYLIVECGTDITIPFTYGGSLDAMDRRNGEEPPLFYPVYLLRLMLYPLDSKEYQQKMEIVKAFALQGVDYWSEPIHESVLSRIQKMYPDTWQEYAEVY